MASGLRIEADDADRNWTQPGIYEVSAGVFRIPLPLPSNALRAVNVYAVANAGKAVLIDGGWALSESEDQLQRCLAQIGYGLADVEHFLVTHVHRDHYSQAVTVRRRFGTPISLGIGERRALESGRDLRNGRPTYQIEQLWAWGAADVAAELAALPPTPYASEAWEAPNTWLDGVQQCVLTDRTLESLPTPGHTQGHVVFRDEAGGLLFAGDHVLPHITPSIGLEIFPGLSPLGDYIESLRVVRDLPDAVLLPAHGPVRASVHRRIDELLEHHSNRLEATLTAVCRGHSTAREVAEHLRWTRHDRSYGELGLQDRAMAVCETGAHLQVLATREMVRMTLIDGVRHYQ
jgi:glyoxylase-like metal-dependent hydrolase (beta-lactamase superfamily II)